MKIQLFIHLFDGSIESMMVSNDMSIKNLIKKIKKKLHIKHDIKLKSNVKLLKYNLSLTENKVKNNDAIFIYIPLNGGFIDLLINLLTGMFDLLKNLGMLIEELIGIIINVMELIPSIFNPDKLINDVLYGVTNGITSMFGGIINQFSTNEEPAKGGIYDDKKNQVCVAPTLINLIILVVCPPLALYKDRGLKGFFLVIVCALLTYYLYYFPGFLFAALHIMC
jgi:hypothetical protein